MAMFLIFLFLGDFDYRGHVPSFLFLGDFYHRPSHPSFYIQKDGMQSKAQTT